MKIAKDTFITKCTIYDKLLHLWGGITSTLVFYFIIPSILVNISLGLFLQIAWEIKDGYLIDYKKYGFWAGDGFSFLDIISFFVGQVITLGYFIIMGAMK
jgi:hypothetical protein